MLVKEIAKERRASLTNATSRIQLNKEMIKLANQNPFYSDS